MSLGSDIAHLEDVSGTFVLPAHTPYDRQMLREHVEMRAGRESTLTLGVHGTRWIITPRPPTQSRCTSCAQFLGRLSCSRPEDADAKCIDCAMQPEATNPCGTENQNE